MLPLHKAVLAQCGVSGLATVEVLVRVDPGALMVGQAHGWLSLRLALAKHGKTEKMTSTTAANVVEMVALRVAAEPRALTTSNSRRAICRCTLPPRISVAK